MWSLRTKLLIAIILPILLLVPLLDLYLLSSLERFLTQQLLHQLTQQAQLLQTQVQQQPEVVENPQAAQQFLMDVAHATDARVILLSSAGTILGTNRREDAGRIGTQFLTPPIAQALQGQPGQGIGPGLSTIVAAVTLPLQVDGVTRGVLRVSYEIGEVRARFSELRKIVIGGSLVVMVLGLALGSWLATTITQPLHQLRQSVQEIAAGNYQTRVAIQRQDEVGMLARYFNQMAERLEEAEAARHRQLAAIVHELARPLTGMRAAAETLLRGAMADAAISMDLLTGIHEEVGRLSRLLDTLRSVAQRALQPLQLHCTRLSFVPIIRASVAHHEPAAVDRGIRLKLDLPPELPAVSADGDCLMQVLTNLLDNALKFTPRGGAVTVAAGEDATTVWVSVLDTGDGIAQNELPYLFQQFYRGAESRPPETRGMGLGLTLCREIITGHGGHIWAESELGHGARFIFTLPKG